MRGILWAALALLPQAMPGQTGAARPAFEVATVKLPDPNNRVLDFRVMPGGRLTVTNQPLRILIQQAYDLKPYQISGGAAWMSSDRFDINAKAEGEPTRPQMMAMLQTLLEDRFHLQVHRETKEGDVFLLVVAKNGPKLKPTVETKTFVGLSRNTPPELPGVSYSIGGKKASVALMAERLADMALRRPVLDRTGIQGEFDFKLDYAIDDNPETGPSIFAAIQEQLGLKLEAGKGPVEMIVIDRAQKPTLEN
jgi:uncharacterized protein (TIGR03435 family)